ncbi:hypothetical protein [Chryseobacterium sp. 2987]|nr:hypothetical protein [Chryseobacterium sp. 2987]
MTNTEIATSYMPGDQSGDIILQTPIHWMGQLTAGIKIQSH